MKNNTSLMIFVALIAGIARAQAPAQAPVVGMILNVDGEVYVQHGSEKTAAHRVDFLRANDKLVIGKGRADVLVCPNSERWNLASGASVDFAGSAVKATGPAPERKPAKCVLPDIRLDDKDRLRFGGLQARGIPPSIALLIGGPVTTARPTFVWLPIANAQSYELEFRDDKGISMWKATSSSTHLDYPSTQPPLDNGKKYQWKLLAKADGKTLAQEQANLIINANPDLARPAPADPAEKLLFGAELENAKYYAEAAAIYRQVRDADPTKPDLTQHLVWLYGSAGLSTVAGEEYLKVRPKQ